MSLTITVDMSQVLAMHDALGLSLDDMADGLTQAVESTLIPDLQLLSSSIWDVVTGAYSEGWEITSAMSNEIIIENMARAITDGYPYALSLEYGWTSRGVVHRGGFVAEQATMGAGQAISEALVGWLMEQLPS